LATFQTREEAKTITSLPFMSRVKLITGFRKQNKWHWRNGSVPVSLFWKSFGKNKFGCGVISKQDLEWKWDYVDCSQETGFICEEALGKLE